MSNLQGLRSIQNWGSQKYLQIWTKNSNSIVKIKHNALCLIAMSVKNIEKSANIFLRIFYQKIPLFHLLENIDVH